MRCKKCGYRLWNLPSRTCPECGADFLPSEFEFTPNSVQFCCPHCHAAYYGTSDKGHLVPVEFECTGCRRHIHMDEMILLPTAGVDEQRTQADRVPWLQPNGRERFRAWLATIGMALVQPGRLGRALPDTGAANAAWGFAILTNTLIFLLGLGVLFAFSMIAGLAAGGASPSGVVPELLLALVIMTASTVVIMLVIMALWGLATHALLRLTGNTHGRLGRTCEALCFSTGANALTAVPCLGFYFGWIWWLVSAVIMVKAAQKVQGWRAALAVLLLPCLSIAGAGSLYAWLIFTAMSGSGSWAMMDAEHRTNLITGALIAYAQVHSGQGPGHAFELIKDGYLQAQDLHSAVYAFNVAPARAKVTVPSPTQFEQMSPRKQQAATDAAIAALPDDVTAHRLGEFVFVYHGIDFDTCDESLWIVVWSPDPADPATLPGRKDVIVGYCDGTVETIDDADFDAALAEQNAVRGEHELSPLSDPRKVAPKQNDAVP